MGNLHDPFAKYKPNLNFWSCMRHEFGQGFGYLSSPMKWSKFPWIGIAFLFAPAAVLSGQDSAQIRHWMNELASPQMHGRGYTNDGLNKARLFLWRVLDSLQLQPVSQPFRHPVNRFPGNMYLSVNGKPLEAGRDFLVSPESSGYNGKGRLMQADSLLWLPADRKLAIQLESKLTWSVAASAEPYTLLQVRRDALQAAPTQFECQVEAQFMSSFESANLMALIPGKRVPDSMVAFCAHYDHLGRMGREALFAGANDNASGVAFLLALAGRLKKEPPDYTAVFLFFAGEEAGLLGSEHFVNHPLVPLDKIRFLLNLDLMGNGEEGMTVVNGTVHTPEFERLLALHAEQPFLPGIYSRGKARNSDHYWFSEKGVPSFFWYTMGARKAYHDVVDVAETVPLFRVESLVDLALRFAEAVASLPRNKPN
jgi:hypothetical protein